MKYYFSILLVVSTVASVAVAQEVAQAAIVSQTWWQLTLTHLLEICVTVLTPSLLIITRRYAEVLANKAGVDLSERNVALLDDVVNRAVSYAHEQGRKALKADQKLSAEDKRAAGINFAAETIKQLGLVNLSQELLEKHIEAKLNLRRDDPVKPGEHAKTNAGRVIPT